MVNLNVQVIMLMVLTSKFICLSLTATYIRWLSDCFHYLVFHFEPSVCCSSTLLLSSYISAPTETLFRLVTDALSTVILLVFLLKLTVKNKVSTTCSVCHLILLFCDIYSIAKLFGFICLFLVLFLRQGFSV